MSRDLNRKTGMSISMFHHHHFRFVNSDFALLSRNVWVDLYYIILLFLLLLFIWLVIRVNHVEIVDEDRYHHYLYYHRRLRWLEHYNCFPTSICIWNRISFRNQKNDTFQCSSNENVCRDNIMLLFYEQLYHVCFHSH